LNVVSKIDDLGLYFGKNLYQIEVDYIMNEEFALFPEYITERRTKNMTNSNNINQMISNKGAE
jgi:glycerol-3-phosphate dehydrogenase